MSAHIKPWQDGFMLVPLEPRPSCCNDTEECCSQGCSHDEYLERARKSWDAVPQPPAEVVDGTTRMYNAIVAYNAAVALTQAGRTTNTHLQHVPALLAAQLELRKIEKELKP